MKVYLVVAEDSAISETLRAALPVSDLVIVETNAEGAARRLISIQVDIILLDDGPGLGCEALSVLKTAAPNTPVVVLSSRSDVLTQATLTRSGADAIVGKPFSFEVLETAVRELHHQIPDTRSDITPVTMTEGIVRTTTLNQHQMALRWLSRAFAYADNPQRFSQSLVESACDIFDTMRTAILLEEGEVVRVAASHGLPDHITNNLTLRYASGLMRWFEEHASLLDRAGVVANPEAAKEFQLLNARIAAPLLRNGRVFGAIVLGEKASGVDYSHEEQELLILVARSTSFACERAGHHAARREEYQHLDSIFSHLNEGVVTVSNDKIVTALNRKAEELLGIDGKYVLGASIQRLGSLMADPILRTISDGEARRNVHITLPPLGRTLQVNVSRMGENGVVVAFSEAPKQEFSRDEISYSPFWEYLSLRVAQEVKNPMVAINTFAQLLPRKYDSPDFREAFSRVVQREVDRINSVVETLFTFSRQPELSLEHCKVNDTLESILGSFSEELEVQRIQLDMSLAPDVNSANLDPVFFSQALHNLLQNSIDAMPEGGKLKVETRIVEEEGKKQTEIRVSDTGRGISNDEAERVFMPFYSTKEHGMGLGLSLAQRIVRQHNGELTLEENDSSTSCFIIHLPALEPKHANHPGD